MADKSIWHLLAQAAFVLALEVVQAPPSAGAQAHCPLKRRFPRTY